MTQHHPDLPEEQAYVDHAYECLERSRVSAWRLRDLNEADMGGTFQARFERNAFDEALVKRLTELDLGQAALVFGRIDRYAESPDTLESFHIGRLAVADEHSDPVVVDWRAPVAEPFYRATGRETMGLARRRHFVVDGPTVLGLEDELFGDGHLGVGHDEGLAPGNSEELDAGRAAGDGAGDGAGHGAGGNGDGAGGDRDAGGAAGAGAGPTLRGYSTLLASLERGRTGTLGDIVATIQAEQDEIIRSPQQGVLVVQGGPGTGKTVVALHRAAYLLYTHRFPLEDQGVLVIGPNRVFLRYIERVLPSLGEAGIEQVVLSDLVPDVRFAGPQHPLDTPLTAKVKGDERMSEVIDAATTDRERAIRNDLIVPFRYGYVRLSVDESSRIVKGARRRFRQHNPARRWVENEVWTAMAATWRDGDADAAEVRRAVRSLPEVREALEWMWPVLTPAELLHDLFGSLALLRSAGAKVLTDDEHRSLYRRRSASVDEVRWSTADAALLDDAREILGSRTRQGRTKNGRTKHQRSSGAWQSTGSQPSAGHEPDEIRTYGHIVIDEVQDLTPMQLKMVARRSLNGSMTVVGDIAQATGPLAPDDWDDVLRHLPDRRPHRVVGLSVGYRIPEQIMELANRVMAEATPGLRAPRSVRVGDAPPRIVHVEVNAVSDAGSDAASLLGQMVDELHTMLGELPTGSIAVVVPDALADAAADALDRAGVEYGRAASTGLDRSVTVVPVSVVKGLELDGVVVVEPARIVADEPHGLRALYVALTRSTQRLVVVHAEPLPPSLAPALSR